MSKRKNWNGAIYNLIQSAHDSSPILVGMYFRKTALKNEEKLREGGGLKRENANPLMMLVHPWLRYAGHETIQAFTTETVVSTFRVKVL